MYSFPVWDTILNYHKHNDLNNNEYIYICFCNGFTLLLSVLHID